MNRFRLFIAAIVVMLYTCNITLVNADANSQLFVEEWAEIGTNSWKRMRVLIEVKININTGERAFIDVDYENTKEWFIMGKEGLSIYDDYGYITTYRWYNYKHSDTNVLGVWKSDESFDAPNVMRRIRRIK